MVDTYPINIVIKDRIWYDSRIAADTEVIYQNVNFTSGNPRSVNVVRQRFMDDWARQNIPNSIRHGIGLNHTGTDDFISITSDTGVGYASVAGRWIEIPDFNYNATTDTLGTAWHYLVIQVENGSITEGDTRTSSSEVAHIQGISFPYTKNHNELVIAKFYYDSGINEISGFEDYTAIQEWQANVISPVSVLPLSTGSDSILLRAYVGSAATEPVNILGIEPDKSRFYLNATFTDQDDPITGADIQLVGRTGVIQVNDPTETNFLGMGMLELSTGSTVAGGATVRIDSSGNLVNIGTLNSQSLVGGNGAGDFITTDGTQTMTDKTLTSPTVTDGTFNSPVLTTPQIEDATSSEQYIFATSEITLDRTITLPLLLANDTFVFEDHIQTLDNKTLTTDTLITTFFQDTIGGSNVITVPAITGTLVVENDESSPVTLLGKKLKTLVVRDSDNTNDITFLMPNVSSTTNFTITSTANDTFMMLNTAATVTAKQTFLADQTLAVGANSWSSANHAHDGVNAGGLIDLNDAINELGIAKGGTGLTSVGAYRLIMGNSAGTAYSATVPSPANGSWFLRGGTSGGFPQWTQPYTGVHLSGRATGTATNTPDTTGNTDININVTSIANYNHLHHLNEVEVYEQNFSPASVNCGGVGVSIQYPDVGTISAEMHQLGDEIHIPLPFVFFNKTVDRVRLRMKASENVKGTHIYIKASYDGTNIVKTADENANITDSWQNYDIILNWSVTNERDSPFIVIEAVEGTDKTVFVSTIQITYL